MKLLFLLLTAFSLTASAGNYKHFESLGFSKDGRYFAFVQSTIQDGSGFPDASVMVVATDTNKLVSYHREIEQEYDYPLDKVVRTAIRKANVTRHVPEPKRYQGNLKLNRLDTDTSEYSNTAFSLDPIAGGASGGHQYAIAVEEKVAPKESHNDYCEDANRKMVRVALLKGYPETTFVLQNDTRQPSTRSCSFDYQVRHVYDYKGRFVVILKYLQYGFEGPDHSFMAVTTDKR